MNELFTWRLRVHGEKSDHKNVNKRSYNSKSSINNLYHLEFLLD